MGPWLRFLDPPCVQLHPREDCISGAAASTGRWHLEQHPFALLHIQLLAIVRQMEAARCPHLNAAFRVFPLTAVGRPTTLRSTAGGQDPVDEAQHRSAAVANAVVQAADGSGPGATGPFSNGLAGPFETALSSVFYRWASASLCAVATH